MSGTKGLDNSVKTELLQKNVKAPKGRRLSITPTGVNIIIYTNYRGFRCATPPANSFDPFGVRVGHWVTLLLCFSWAGRPCHDCSDLPAKTIEMSKNQPRHATKQKICRHPPGLNQQSSIHGICPDIACNIFNFNTSLSLSSLICAVIASRSKSLSMFPAAT